jgi:Zn-dependent protease with chaperone function
MGDRPDSRTPRASESRADANGAATEQRAAAALLKYETLDESAAHAAAGLPERGSAPGSFTAAAFGVTPAVA